MKTTMKLYAVPVPLIVCLLLSTLALGQKVKSKDIKRELEDGSISKLEIICPEIFYPSVNFNLDIQITLSDGVTTALASEHHVIWRKSVVTVTNATLDSQDGLFSKDKGEIIPYDVSGYYPKVPITVNVQFGTKTVSKSLLPNFCYSNGYTIWKTGNSGSNGSGGSMGGTQRNGSNGSPGRNGSNGPNLDVQIEEEAIEGKTFMIVAINGKKYPFDPSCGAVKVISVGGKGGKGGSGGRGGTGGRADGKYYESGYSGGSGGEGGDGGSGGSVYVSGPQLNKYRALLTFDSQGGNGGEGGSGGGGGVGKSYGRSGVKGRDGRNGSPGQVNFQAMPAGTPEYSASPQQIVIAAPAADTQGDLLVTSDILVTLKLDGEVIGTADVGKNVKVKANQGERLLEIIPDVAKNDVITEIVDVKAQSQVIKQIKLKSKYPASGK